MNTYRTIVKIILLTSIVSILDAQNIQIPCQDYSLNKKYTYLYVTPQNDSIISESTVISNENSLIKIANKEIFNSQSQGFTPILTQTIRYSSNTYTCIASSIEAEGSYFSAQIIITPGQVLCGVLPAQCMLTFQNIQTVNGQSNSHEYTRLETTRLLGYDTIKTPLGTLPVVITETLRKIENNNSLNEDNSTIITYYSEGIGPVKKIYIDKIVYQEYTSDTEISSEQIIDGLKELSNGKNPSVLNKMQEDKNKGKGEIKTLTFKSSVELISYTN